MKRMKKILALVLSLALALTLALPAFAATEVDADGKVTVDGVEITLPGKPGAGDETVGGSDAVTHTYYAYQIFTGKYADNADGSAEKVLTEIKWGNGVKASDLVTALTGDAYTTALTDLGYIVPEGETLVNPFAGIKYNTDTPNVSADAVARVVAGFGDNTLEARAFAKVVDDNKTSTHVEKDGTLVAGFYLTVDETKNLNGTTSRSLYILQMTTDSQAFAPEGKIDVPKIDKKVYEVNDSTAATGNHWSDTVADYDINDHVAFILTGTLPNNYADYKTYKYEFSDTLSAGLTLVADTITVLVNGNVVDSSLYTVDGTNTQTFTVTFNDLKTTGLNIDANSYIQVFYTATLNSNAISGGEGNPNTAKLTYSNDPNYTGDGTNEPTGTTPEDKVVVFTFNLVANKIDEDEQPLNGAGFTLYKYDYDKDVNDVVGTDAEKEEAKYVAVGQEIKDVTTFTFKGLDAGKYKLVETTVPTGYNKAEDMYFEITATYNETSKEVTGLTIGEVKDKNNNVIANPDGSAAITFTADEANSSLTTDIMNLRGILLPSTGGIGTTIFYVVGGLLIIGAGVLLIAKKRMGGHAE